MAINFVVLDSSKLNDFIYIGKQDVVKEGFGRDAKTIGKVYKFQDIVKGGFLSVIHLGGDVTKRVDIRPQEKVNFGSVIGKVNATNSGVRYAKIYTDNIFAQDLSNRPVLKTNLNVLDKFKGSNEQVDFMNYIDLATLPIDIAKTLGKLTFSGLRSSVNELDDEGNSTDLVNKQKYSLFSVEQGDEVVVNVIGQRDYNFKIGDEVKLINPIIKSFAIDRYTYGFVLTVDDIISIDVKTDFNKDKK